jgi:hypothetical protein
MAENAGQFTAVRKKKISSHDRILALFIAGNKRKFYYKTPLFLLNFSE